MAGPRLTNGSSTNVSSTNGNGTGSEADLNNVGDESTNPPEETNHQPPSYPLPPPARPTQSVLPEDLKTPDSHVPRDPRLIRLTGVHPFNVEAPLTALWEEGFITTKDLHFVRNHGSVPVVHDDEVLDWAFSVEGLVERPFTTTLRELLAGHEQVTYPVTLVCAGNRRKEQNVVRKTRGFSWGPAGLSTALWTGVPLHELLARARPVARAARYVCLEGADALPNGRYGTSIRLGWAMDPGRGVLVAHRMNGEPLPPDHGKPLRVIIPGQIGGRSVKWLKRIVVTAAPSDSWYHIYDNRVLPTAIGPEESGDVPDTWRDERYAIYDLNTNSAIARPAHDERVVVGGGEGAVESYKVQGYAYAGGGKRVTRVEVTLDRGRTWRLADVRYPEDDYRRAAEGETLFGGRLDVGWRETCFCWCFWSLEIPTADLVADDRTCTGDVMVRAMDDSMMVQPREMYWSVLGMMNNPWFRVVIHREVDGDGNDALRFEHPTQPTFGSVGWMERVKKEGGNLANGYWGEKEPGGAATAETHGKPDEKIVMTSKHVDRQITSDEVKAHESEAEPWFVLDGEVYDGTKFLDDHPGGGASIIAAAGQDVTEEFLAIHSENAKAMMPFYHVGTLDAASKKLLESEPEAAPPSGGEPKLRPTFLSPKTWHKAALTRKTQVNSDTKLFSFATDHESQALGLPVGQHVMVRLRDPVTREAVIRAYTPLSDPDAERGRVDLLIKVYEPTGEFPRGGLMTSALSSLPMGHWVEFKGPVGKFVYLGRGRCRLGGRERIFRRFVMICAGSGITPIFAVLRAVLKDPEDMTRCVVLDGNRTEEDILCREELQALIEGKGARVRLLHTLSRPDEKWTGGKGRMDQKMLESEVGPPGKARDELVMVCGPEAMEEGVRVNLTKMGWREEDMLFF
ncbi:hypothetical protein SLS53_004219 [Cytospora paraplurivora]|uniref:Nitrate reductase n=1 Tax=Cytospora paraplurivora TaxID=2898453 RepID=A0AAN9YHF5_9PEZI